MYMYYKIMLHGRSWIEEDELGWIWAPISLDDKDELGGGWAPISLEEDELRGGWAQRRMSSWEEDFGGTSWKLNIGCVVVWVWRRKHQSGSHSMRLLWACDNDLEPLAGGLVICHLSKSAYCLNHHPTRLQSWKIHSSSSAWSIGTVYHVLWVTLYACVGRSVVISRYSHVISSTMF